MDYYYLTENLWLGDCVNSKELEAKICEMGISEETLWDMVYEKLQPIIDTAAAEFKETEEFKTDEKHKAILSLYSQAKDSFEEKYGPGTYDKRFDIFGVLRNEEYLRQLEESYEFQQKYNFSGGYSDFDFGNYSGSYHKNSSGNYNFGGYGRSKVSNYSEEDKQRLKKMYKLLALQFHPDRNGDAEMMKLLNRVKEDLGI